MPDEYPRPERPANLPRQVPTPPRTATPEVLDEVREWLLQRTSGVLYTIDKDGFPTGRAMGMSVNADFSLDLVQWNGTGRVHQARRNPELAVYMSDGYGKRSFYLKGRGAVLTGDAMMPAVQKRIAVVQARGGTWGPSEQEARDTLAAIHIEPVYFRTEHFGEGMGIWEWRF